jgi:hypothetical protein
MYLVTGAKVNTAEVRARIYPKSVSRNAIAEGMRVNLDRIGSSSLKEPCLAMVSPSTS